MQHSARVTDGEASASATSVYRIVHKVDEGCTFRALLAHTLVVHRVVRPLQSFLFPPLRC